MRILLAYKANAAGAKDPYTSLLPVGLGYINAVLRAQGFKSRIANLSNSAWKETTAFLKSEKPDILAVSQFTHNRFESLKLAATAKKVHPACFVVFGGPHATLRAREILANSQDVDAVILGEGEETFLDLVHSLATRKRNLESIRGMALRSGSDVLLNQPREPLANLEYLPIPAAYYDNAFAVDLHRQLEFIITSRGCPAACRFCSSPSFWGKTLRFRSPQSILDEIKYIRDNYGLIYFSLRDDTFTADRERVMAFCRLLLQEKIYILWNCQSRVNAVDQEMLLMMKRAGCECIQFGVESGSPNVLKELGKKITAEQVKSAALATRRAGINLSIYLITGIPGETDEDLKATLRLIDEIKPGDGQVSPLAYYPGTSLFEKGVLSGSVARDIFETIKSPALYVRDDSFVARSTMALLAKLETVSNKSSCTLEEFRTQKKVLGYCHATNVLAGAFYENTGHWRLAEQEYMEIVEREPSNPWGWLVLGELYAELGIVDKAKSALKELLRFIPKHAPAYTQLGELYLLTADFHEAERMYKHALFLDPGDTTARKGVIALHEKK